MAQKQYLRDAEHLDFLAGQLDRLCEYIKKDMAEEGVSAEQKDTERGNVRRLRLLQGNLRHNRDEVRRKEASGVVPDEF